MKSVLLLAGMLAFAGPAFSQNDPSNNGTTSTESVPPGTGTNPRTDQVEPYGNTVQGGGTNSGTTAMHKHKMHGKKTKVKSKMKTNPQNVPMRSPSTNGAAADPVTTSATPQ